MHAVHSTVTYLAPANDYFRKTISLDALMGIRPSISTATSLENNTNNAVPQVRAVRCLDSDVSCALELPAGSTATGNGGQMVLRARVPRQVPAVRTMYIYTYRDAAAHRLASVTAVTLRSAQRVDLVGYLGQTTRVTLMVSGAAGSSGVDLQQKQLGGMVGAAGDGDISSRFTVPTTSSRQVVCYSSAKSPIVSVPSGVFGITIGSGGSQEVPVTFSPDAIGEDTVLVHLVGMCFAFFRCYWFSFLKIRL
ncbi:hypothetical protein BC828DRAFT_262877 [Blastocladiella britannica]|nr:hypothetical protein BC828DRAFT_262877 [Blastocladiella britannica]